jgi:hypothetical protein
MRQAFTALLTLVLLTTAAWAQDDSDTAREHARKVKHKRADAEQLMQAIDAAPLLVPTSAPAPEPQLETARPAVPPAALTTTVAPAIETRPFYKKWWFWTATAVVAGAAITAIAVGATQGQPRETSFQVQSL